MENFGSVFVWGAIWILACLGLFMLCVTVWVLWDDFWTKRR